jgi:hypothetical protein
MNEHENKNLIETLGDKIGESLPESWRTERVAYCLGSVCGFLAGFLFSRMVSRTFFPPDQDDEK